jgi:dipeptidyl aminopeptidase/acylaminoacyl peptidase
VSDGVSGRRGAGAALLLAISAVAAPAQAPARRPLAVDDLFALKQVGTPQVSPDGRWVAYTVRSTNLKADRNETMLWMAPLDSGRAAVPLTAPGYAPSDARWSPDGKYLSFLATRPRGPGAAPDSSGEPKTQVWALDRRGGEARPLTRVPQGVDAYEWSPDGTRLVLAIRDTLGTPWSGKSARPRVITRLQFKQDGTGYLDTLRTHLYVLTLASGALTQVTSGNDDESDPAWSPDGQWIAFVSNRTPDPDANRNTDIWIVAADTARGRALRQVTTNPGPDVEPSWSPDGKQVAYVMNAEPDLIWYATAHLAVVPAAGGTPRVLTTALDRNVGSPHFAPDGRSIWFLLEDAGERDLARIGVDGSGLVRPVSGHIDVGAYALAPDGAPVALVSWPDLPGELFQLNGDSLRRVTTTNDSLMQTIELGGTQKVKFPSTGGAQIEAFIFTPPGYRPGGGGAPLPTLLRIHGGPVSQYSWRFNFESQLFAANGYAVLNVNPRGSSGYGEAFCKAIFADWGNKDYDDVMAGVEWAIRAGIADPKRLGVGGWSYGGILTDHVIVRTTRFAAAITGASEVLYVANYGHDHYQYEWEKELGLPWRARAAWERLSPFNSVEKIVTPTLIMGGDVDWNVPIQNSEQLYQALRRLGRTTELVVYPGEPHGLRAPSHLQDRLRRYLAWYDRFVKPTR